MRRKRIAILGSTGSIGLNTLNVIKKHPKEFKVEALTAFHNVELLEKQIKEFLPSHVAVERQGFEYLRSRLNGHKVKIWNTDQIEDVAALPQIDTVVLGIRGSAALMPFLAAIRQGKRIAPANKEALVMAGRIIMKEAARYQAVIIPVDSEQSAIFQCLDGRERKELKKIYLPASGGPLYGIQKNQFDKLTVNQILKHPRWKMGKKITVDSATLMNKGLEVIEAKWLFGLNIKDIKVLIHPEAVVHSMVEFKDGSILAQMGVTDMRLSIQYA